MSWDLQQVPRVGHSRWGLCSLYLLGITQTEVLERPSGRQIEDQPHWDYCSENRNERDGGTEYT